MIAVCISLVLVDLTYLALIPGGVRPRFYPQPRSREADQAARIPPVEPAHHGAVIAHLAHVGDGWV